MMQASHHGYLDDSALVGALHRCRLRGVLLQREVGSVMGVVGEVILEHATRVGLVHDEHGRLVVDDAQCAVLDSLHVTDPSARSLTAQTRSVMRSHWGGPS